MPRRCKHKLERYLEQPRVLRCKRCAEHCETICSGCGQPICLRHNIAPATSFEIRCAQCAMVSVVPFSAGSKSA